MLAANRSRLSLYPTDRTKDDIYLQSKRPVPEWVQVFSVDFESVL